MNTHSHTEEDLYEHYNLTVDVGQNPLRVDKFLTNRIEGVSRTKWQEAAEKGCIRVNGIPVKSNYKVKPDDTISVQLAFPKRELTIIPQNLPIDIVYEDDTVMVINKAAGMVVHPGHGNYDQTLVNAIAYHLKDQPFFKENDPRMGLVHRIDKDTSGLLVVAKTEAAKSNLSHQFFTKSTERKYEALIWGVPKQTKGTIIGKIGRDPSDRLIFKVFPDDYEHGKEAVTHYEVLEDMGYVARIECVLETGRTHQIRVHTKHIGHPIFNDDRYGGDKILRGTSFSKYKQFVDNCFSLLPRQGLHAKMLGFVHPDTRETMRFETSLPADMTQVIQKWREYISTR